MKSSVLPLFAILFIAFVTTYKSYSAYKTFHENNIPVYDGVMYEKHQIQTYLRFKNNFSLKERLNQVYYEFTGNGLNPGFNCLVILLNPQWLISDTDVILRGFLGIFIFALVFFFYLESRVGRLNSIIIILLLFQLPLFYHFRYGVATYIPEISSALFLLAGYVQLLNFIDTEKLFFFYTSCILIILSIMFRMNFFVYAFFFILPLLYKTASVIHAKPTKSMVFAYSFALLCILFLIGYIVPHLNFFLNYYKSEIPYDTLSYPYSFSYLLKNFKEEIGIGGGLALLLIIVVAGNTLENKKVKTIDRFYLLYPFLFHFTFIILYMKACNVPHVIAAMVIFLSFAFSIPLKISQVVYFKSKKIVLTTIGFSVILLNTSYAIEYNSYKKNFTIYTTSKNVIEYIKADPDFNNDYRYICFYDEMAEIPIDVSLFNSTKKWLNSTDHFYFHDALLYNSQNSLSDTVCANYYIKKINNNYYDLIAINDSVNKAIVGYPLARKVNRIIEQYLGSSDRYIPVKSIQNDYTGTVTLYKRKSDVN